jgi:hypothetical protein
LILRIALASMRDHSLRRLLLNDRLSLNLARLLAVA